MKKFGFFVGLCILLSAFMLCACSGGLSKKQKSVSEYRDDVLIGESGNFTAEAVTGYRETPFEIDGKSGEKCDFCLITIKPKNFDPTAEYKYKVVLAGTEYEGDAVKHPFESSYSFELPVRNEGSELEVFVSGESIKLASVKEEGYITAEKAYEIAAKRLASTKIVKSNKYEIYIRLISNPISATGGYFWYVAFVDENKDTCATLIDPITMEITAVRE